MTRARPTTSRPALLLALFAGPLGYWLGLSRAPASTEPVVTLLACPETESSCPPPPEKAATPGRPPATAKAPKPRNSLPNLAPGDPDRERLLAYIRAQSSPLRECVKATPERVNLTVQLFVGAKGTVRRARVVQPELAERAPATCIEQRMTGWQLPGAWAEDEQSLLVAVVL